MQLSVFHFRIYPDTLHPLRIKKKQIVWRPCSPKHSVSDPRRSAKLRALEVFSHRRESCHPEHRTPDSLFVWTFIIHISLGPRTLSWTLVQGEQLNMRAWSRMFFVFCTTSSTFLKTLPASRFLLSISVTKCSWTGSPSRPLELPLDYMTLPCFFPRKKNSCEQENKGSSPR